MKLAIFDLDNTLLATDSDYSWGQFLVGQGLVDGDEYTQRNQAFYADYQAGRLDIQAFLRFTLAPLTRFTLPELDKLHSRFMAEVITPAIARQAPALLARHRAAGHYLLIITATNAFVTTPIARALGVDDILATPADVADGRYTGESTGTPCFQDGKITRLEAWLKEHDRQPEATWFYSDSINDLPLLERADHPVAVDPDERLREQAAQRGWPVISLRGDRLDLPESIAP